MDSELRALATLVVGAWIQAGCFYSLSDPLPESCSEGLGDCDATVPGCETSLENNDRHCGTCGYDCRETSCTGTICTPVQIAAGQNRAYAIIVDDAYVYWTNDDEGNVPRNSGVWWAPKDAIDPSQAAPCAITDSGVPRGITQSETDIYWVDMGRAEILAVQKPCPNNNGEVLHQMAFDPQNPAPGDLGPEPIAIALDGGSLYWTDARKGSVFANIWTLELDTPGSAQPLLADLPQCITANGSCDATVEACPCNSPWYLAVDAGYVYFTHFSSGRVGRVARDAAGRGAVQCAGDAGGTVEGWGIVLDDSHIYWRVSLGLRVADKEPPCGGGDVVAAGQAELRPRDLARDGTELFWVRGEVDSEIVSVCVDGASERVIARAPAHGLTVDANYVYWTEWSDSRVGGVYRVARPPACGTPNRAP